MSLNSMTGFARDDGAKNDFVWHWEIKTVNGRNLDIRCRMAQGFESLEPKLREQVAKAVRRGSCQIAFSVRHEGAEAQIEINQETLALLVAEAERLSANDKLAPARIDGLLALRGVLQGTDTSLTSEQVAEIEPDLLASFATTLEGLKTARRAEGEKLEKILRDQIAEVQRLSEAARDCPARQTEAIKQRLSENLSKLLDQTSELDPDRLHQEAVMLAARADIQEELDRLFAHVEAANELMNEEGAIGRKFDFLVQELNREANTLCSKSNHSSLTTIGLELKGVIDQIREQVQNIE